MIEMYLWGFLAISLPTIMLTILFLNTGKIYDYNLKMKNENPFLFKIFGMNEKHLDNKSAWVKHQRIFMAIVTLLLLCIMVPIVMFI